MKKFIITFIILFFATVCYAEGKESTEQITMNGINIRWDEPDEFIEIRTNNNTLRVYKCGKVEKLEWKEINPNEDTTTWDSGTIEWMVGDSNVYWYDENGTIRYKTQY